MEFPKDTNMKPQRNFYPLRGSLITFFIFWLQDTFKRKNHQPKPNLEIGKGGTTNQYNGEALTHDEFLERLE